jgi:hypothetical protein
LPAPPVEPLLPAEAVEPPLPAVPVEPPVPAPPVEPPLPADAEPARAARGVGRRARVLRRARVRSGDNAAVDARRAARIDVRRTVLRQGMRHEEPPRRKS